LLISRSIGKGSPALTMLQIWPLRLDHNRHVLKMRGRVVTAQDVVDGLDAQRGELLGKGLLGGR
jgi:hypothetical protein